MTAEVLLQRRLHGMAGGGKRVVGGATVKLTTQRTSGMSPELAAETALGSFQTSACHLKDPAQRRRPDFGVGEQSAW